jgi:hypothetical protein
MIIYSFDSYVIHGWFEGYGWHVLMIVPINGTIQNCVRLRDLAKTAVELSTGHETSVVFLPAGQVLVGPPQPTPPGLP